MLVMKVSFCGNTVIFQNEDEFSYFQELNPQLKDVSYSIEWVVL